MKKYLLISLFLSVQCFSQDSDSLKRNATDTKTANRILIINTLNAQEANYRKNKKALFRELADSLKRILATEINMSSLGEPVIIAEVMPRIFDSKALLDSLFTTYNASYAIVIKNIDAFFEQTKVEVTREDDGHKSREASYDICSDVGYALYKRNGKPYHSVTKRCDDFTTRNVMSGLLAGGPDIVGKSKHAFRAIEKNGRLYISGIEDQLK